VSVPDLKGMTKAQAEAALSANKLKGEATEAPNEATAGTVFAQDPAPNKQVKESSTVAYSISTGPESVEVPPVTGMTEDDAKQAIADVGLKVSKVVLVNDPAQAKGRVLETVPPAREKVAKGTGIELRVASGKVVIPTDLVGLDWAVVAQRLDALKIRAIKQEVDSTKPSGQVLAVESAGKAVPVNSDVTVQVARTPAQTQTPTPTTPAPTDTATDTVTLPLPTTPPPAGG
jgi:serine/threonine-protein kinase